MFSFNNDPRCTRTWVRPSPPRSYSAKPAEQMEQEVNLEEFLGAIASAASIANSVAEPRVSFRSAHSQKPGSIARQNTAKINSNKFEVKVDVTNFSPEEITVKVVDNSILVEAKHEEKEDKFGFISRQFTRRFVLPEGVILEKMTCKMASDNIIVISAPRVVEKPPTNERSIPITFIGQQPNTPPAPKANTPEVNKGTLPDDSTSQS